MSDGDTLVTYPDGRVLTYNYGTDDGMNDAACRVNKFVDSDGGSTELAQYTYLGLGMIVEVNHPQPDLKYTLVDTSGGTDPDTGDIYSGLDRFGRIKDCRWLDMTGPTDVARYKYGYDRASNRLWREDTVATSQSQAFDELYEYDGLYRLHEMGRGTLNGGHTVLTTLTFAQCWTLDETGNWSGFRSDDNGNGVWNLEQERTANMVNEITGLTPPSSPAGYSHYYDRAGNLSRIPSTTPASGLTWPTLTVDEWDTLTVDEWDTLSLDGFE
ncbi:MAG: hypothetical protein AB7I48_24080 [Planctomycetaceae bacterium]